eukprot:1332195-Rhodomonas_salina.2
MDRKHRLTEALGVLFLSSYVTKVTVVVVFGTLCWGVEVRDPLGQEAEELIHGSKASETLAENKKVDMSDMKAYTASDSHTLQMDWFSGLPAGLLGKIWPAERVVAGLRVCRWLHDELLSHVHVVVLILSKGQQMQADANSVEQTMRFFQSLTVHLRWNSSRVELLAIDCIQRQPSLGQNLVELDLRDCYDLPGLAEVLPVCTALTHLNLSDNYDAEFDGLGSDVLAALSHCQVPISALL